MLYFNKSLAVFRINERTLGLIYPDIIYSNIPSLTFTPADDKSGKLETLTTEEITASKSKPAYVLFFSTVRTGYIRDTDGGATKGEAEQPTWETDYAQLSKNRRIPLFYRPGGTGTQLKPILFAKYPSIVFDPSNSLLTLLYWSNIKPCEEFTPGNDKIPNPQETIPAGAGGAARAQPGGGGGGVQSQDKFVEPWKSSFEEISPFFIDQIEDPNSLIRVVCQCTGTLYANYESSRMSGVEMLPIFDGKPKVVFRRPSDDPCVGTPVIDTFPYPYLFIDIERAWRDLKTSTTQISNAKGDKRAYLDDLIDLRNWHNASSNPPVLALAFQEDGPRVVPMEDPKGTNPRAGLWGALRDPLTVIESGTGWTGIDTDAFFDYQRQHRRFGPILFEDIELVAADPPVNWPMYKASLRWQRLATAKVQVLKIPKEKCDGEPCQPNQKPPDQPDPPITPGPGEGPGQPILVSENAGGGGSGGAVAGGGGGQAAAIPNNTTEAPITPAQTPPTIEQGQQPQKCEESELCDVRREIIADYKWRPWWAIPPWVPTYIPPNTPPFCDKEPPTTTPEKVPPSDPGYTYDKPLTGGGSTSIPTPTDRGTTQSFIPSNNIFGGGLVMGPQGIRSIVHPGGAPAGANPALGPSSESPNSIAEANYPLENKDFEFLQMPDGFLVGYEDWEAVAPQFPISGPIPDPSAPVEYFGADANHAQAWCQSPFGARFMKPGATWLKIPVALTDLGGKVKDLVRPPSWTKRQEQASSTYIDEHGNVQTRSFSTTPYPGGWPLGTMPLGILEEAHLQFDGEYFTVPLGIIPTGFGSASIALPDLGNIVVGNDTGFHLTLPKDGYVSNEALQTMLEAQFERSQTPSVTDPFGGKATLRVAHVGSPIASGRQLTIDYPISKGPLSRFDVASVNSPIFGSDNKAAIFWGLYTPDHFDPNDDRVISEPSQWRFSRKGVTIFITDAGGAKINLFVLGTTRLVEIANVTSFGTVSPPVTPVDIGWYRSNFSGGFGAFSINVAPVTSGPTSFLYRLLRSELTINENVSAKIPIHIYIGGFD